MSNVTDITPEEDGWQSPPWPEPYEPLLGVIMGLVTKRLEQGDDPAEVALHAAVTAWREGHLEGHACTGDVELEEAAGADLGVRQAVKDGKKIVSREQAEKIAAQMGIDADYLAKQHGVHIVG